MDKEIVDYMNVIMMIVTVIMIIVTLMITTNKTIKKKNFIYDNPYFSVL